MKLSMDYVAATKNSRKKIASKAGYDSHNIKLFNRLSETYRNDKTAFLNKTGEAFIGPVMMRLKYEGIVRNVFTEEAIERGKTPYYDVLTEFGEAYLLEDYQSEVRITQFEGKRLQYDFVNIAAFPVVQEQDTFELSYDIAEAAIETERQRIQEREDELMLHQLAAAAESFTADHKDFAGNETHVIEVTGDFKPEDFYNAGRIVTQNRLEPVTIIMNPGDMYDIYAWNHDQTSVDFRNKTFEGVPVVSFAGFDILTSPAVEKGEAYVLPASDYLGRFPVRQPLEIKENPRAENFTFGWVMNERVNIILLNPYGVVKLEKTA